jgi:hypothetical protein
VLHAPRRKAAFAALWYVRIENLPVVFVINLYAIKMISF